MKIVSQPLLTAALLCMNLLLCSCSSSSDGSTGRLPERITFSGVGTHGIFDPAVTHDPESGRLWMSYSAVDPSVSWPANYDVVSTRLAYSTDNGNTWIDTGSVINPVLDVTLPLTSPNDAGTWVSEVSQLIYDPGANSSERWKLLWHHYLQINSVRYFEHGWIAMKMASSPEALATAGEIKLFGAVAYNTGNNVAGGLTGSPVGGAPLIQLDTDVDPALNQCIFTEPGMYATNNALYVTMLCVHINDISLRQIVLLKCTSPCNTGDAASWAYLGNILDETDAAAFGFDTGFSAPGIFTAAGAVYLVVTPVQTSGAPWESYYSGCRIFRFSDLDTAQLQTTGSVPTLIDSVNGSAGTFNGACSYHTSASNSGILYSELDLSATDRFRIYKSHSHYTSFLN